MVHSVKTFSRIGELVQGILPDGASFLVSGFLSRLFFSEASLEEGLPGQDMGMLLPPKARKALQLFCEVYGIAEGRQDRTQGCFPGRAKGAQRGQMQEPGAGVIFRLESNIPPGKGLSSSSADILSVLSLANSYWETGCSAGELNRIAARIEPTDPCLSGEIVLFKQQTGITEREWVLPPLSLLYFDAAPGLRVDTLLLRRPYDEKAPAVFEELLDRFERSALAGDYPELFECITHSAVYNQSILPLPRFEEYYRLARQSKTGLMVAHSGTIVGLVTKPEEAAHLLPELEKVAGRYGPVAVYTEYYLSSTN